MRNVIAPGTWLGYCTNVHAGASLDETRANLETYAVAVRDHLECDEALGIGLWLSHDATRELSTSRDCARLRQWLEARDLAVFTLNGFPYGDFHERVVKTRVYEPSWLTDERADYTIALARILAGIGADCPELSISTLPLGWGFELNDDASARAWRQIRRVIDALETIERDTNRLVHLDIEPEPGCVLGSHADLVAWLDRMLPSGDEGGLIRRHLRVCHDVCHAAVMFEDQQTAIDAYDAIGVRIGKVQVSNAIRADITDASAAQLAACCEERYQHQTTCRTPSGTVLFEADLPDMLQRRKADPASTDGEWRVHFHVPVGLEQFGALETTRSMIEACLPLLRHRVEHWEIETYAWDVLPAPLRTDDLAAGIAAELRWFKEFAS